MAIGINEDKPFIYKLEAKNFLDENTKIEPGKIYWLGKDTIAMYDPTALETVIEAPETTHYHIGKPCGYPGCVPITMSFPDEAPKTCFIKRHAPGCECGIL